MDHFGDISSKNSCFVRRYGSFKNTIFEDCKFENPSKKGVVFFFGKYRLLPLFCGTIRCNRFTELGERTENVFSMFDMAHLLFHKGRTVELGKTAIPNMKTRFLFVLEAP